MQDALMDLPAASLLPHVDGSASEESGEIKPERGDVVGLALGPASMVHSPECRCASHWSPLRLTISVKKIDRLLAEVQKEVESLLEEMMALRLVRTQLGDYEHEQWGDR